MILINFIIMQLFTYYINNFNLIIKAMVLN